MRSPVTRAAALPLAVAAAAALVVAACGGDDDGASAGDGEGQGGRLQVVASFYPLAEAAARIGGDRVEVTDLTPAGTEPHDVELTPDQVDDIEDADVAVYLGAGFQPAVAEAAERRDGVTLDVAEGLDLGAGATEALEAEEGGEHGGGEEGGEHGGGEEGGEHGGGEEGGEHGGGEVDPHFWLDPRLMATAVGEIEAALAEAAPGDADTFAANADRYEGELAALDDEMAAGLSSCQRHEIVTSHAAFHYLAERYGLTQLPIAGLSPESEPDPDRLAVLADRVREDGVTTVFTETLASPDVAETLAREAGVETAVLNPLEGLTDEQVDAGDDYASVMRQNLAALTEALGCG